MNLSRFWTQTLTRRVKTFWHKAPARGFETRSRLSVTALEDRVTPQATHFAVIAPPTPVTAGTPFTFTVLALDVNNVVDPAYAGTVSFTSSDTGAGVVLPADYTFSPGTDFGAHTFTNGATLVTAGNQTITATDTADSSITGTSANIDVVAASATQFVVAAPPTATAGVPFSFTVTAEDQFGNVDTTYAGSATITTSDNGAGVVLPANYAFVPATDMGTHTFTNGATLVTAGNQTITATDTANSSITGTSGNIDVSAATATHFTVAAPATTTAGAPFTFTVTAKDQFGNVDTAYAGTATFTSSDTGAGVVLPASYTFAPATDLGTHTFTSGATLVTAGNQTITATDTANSSITGTSGNILVAAATATQFGVSAPTTATAGSPFTVTVTAEDQFGNINPNYAGTLHFTSTDTGTGVVLPANYTFVPATDSGAHTFTNGATLVTPGTQTITATDTANSSNTGTSNNIAVNAATATHFTVSAPSAASAGAPFSFTVTAEDQFGNLDTAYAGTVHFTSTDTGTGVVLPIDYTFVPATDMGTHTFTNGATLVTAGNQTITATDTVSSSISGTSNTINVSAGAASQFAVSAPTSVAAAVPFTFTVTAQDAFHNPVTGYGGTVHFTSTDAAATLPANSTLTNGAGTFTATLRSAGTQAITATDTATAAISGVSNAITVNAASTVLPRNLAIGGETDGSVLLDKPDANGAYSSAATLSPFGSVSVNIRTATGDVNGDGIEDTILITGPGVPTRFAVVSGADNSTLLIPSTVPFAGSSVFTGGGFVSAADFDHDGRWEIVLTPDVTGGPRVVVFSLLPTGLTTRANFFGIDDPNFRGGARTGSGDVNSDGIPDLAVAAGFLGGPRIALFNGATLFTSPTRLINDFFAFPGTDAVNLRNGAYVSIGDVDGDSFGDLIFGAGPGGAPRVFTLSGAQISSGNVFSAYSAPVANFFVAGDSTDRGGVRVATKNADGDTKADVIVGSGQDVASRARVYLGKNFTSSTEPGTFQDLMPFGGVVLADGIYVG